MAAAREDALERSAVKQVINVYSGADEYLPVAASGWGKRLAGVAPLSVEGSYSGKVTNVRKDVAHEGYWALLPAILQPKAPQQADAAVPLPPARNKYV